MSDVNVSVVAVDSAMDCLERIQNAAGNYQRVVGYDLSTLASSLDYKLHRLRNEHDAVLRQQSASENDDEDDGGRAEAQAELYALEQRQVQLEALRVRVQALQTEYLNESQTILRSIAADTGVGLREMAAYLRKLNKIDGLAEGSAGGITNLFTGEKGYYVVVIDSARHPQTAEHIRSAIRSGQPAMLTLDRSGAAENRRQSLAGFPVSSLYDRDEYPPAAFAEGGAGADVFYVESSDNQGAGSTTRWQLEGVPDGSRVRFRVI